MTSRRPSPIVIPFLSDGQARSFSRLSISRYSHAILFSNLFASALLMLLLRLMQSSPSQTQYEYSSSIKPLPHSFCCGRVCSSPAKKIETPSRAARCFFCSRSRPRHSSATEQKHKQLAVSSFHRLSQSFFLVRSFYLLVISLHLQKFIE